jgi:putative transposase
MAHLPRLIVPGIPYHITQRGNRRAQTFFGAGYYALVQKARTKVWSYCPMLNHVHVIVVPADEKAGTGRQ